MNTSSWIAAWAGVLAISPGTGRDDRQALTLAQGKEFRIVSVRQLTAPFAKDPMPRIGFALSQAFQEVPADRATFELPSEAPFDMDALIDSVRSIDPARWEEPGSAILDQGGKLFVSNSGDVIDRAVEHLDQLRKTVLPRLALRYVLFQPRAAEGGGMQRLDRDEARRLYLDATSGKLGEVLHSGAARCRAGDRVHMGERRTVRFQMDLSTEVATKSKAGDPRLGELTLGEGLACMPLVRPDGKGIAVFGFLTWRRLGSAGIHSQDIVAPGSHVELAEIDQVQRAFSLALEGDGGALISFGGVNAPPCRALLLVERIDPAVPPQAMPAILPTGLVTSDALRLLRPPASVRWQADGVKEQPVGFTEKLEIDTIAQLCRTLAGDPDTGFELRVGPVHLTARGGQQQVEASLRAARFAMRHLDRSFVIELTQEGQPEDQPGAEWTDLGQPIVIPCLGQRVGYALQGTERSYVADFNVEIAQNSSIADPVISVVFDGSRVLASVEPLDKLCRVGMHLLAKSLLGLRRVAPGAENAGAVWCPEVSEVELHRSVVLTPGESQELGEGPVREIHGRRYRTRLGLTLREL